MHRSEYSEQNNGAGNRKNIIHVLKACLLLQMLIGFAIGSALFMNGHFMMSLFTSDEKVIAVGIIRLKIVVWWVFLNGIADVFAGSLRAIGYSLGPTLMTLLGICGSRFLYILMIFPHFNTLEALYLCYPLSWLLTILILAIMWIRIVFSAYKEFRSTTV